VPTSNVGRLKCPFAYPYHHPRQTNSLESTDSEEQKALLKDPDLYLAYRKAIEDSFSRRYPYLLNGGSIATSARSKVAEYMTSKLASRPGLIEAVLPSAEEFGIGCRRQTFAYGYLEAITHPKSTVLLQPPETFTKRGVLDADGWEWELDMVIAATGYDQSLAPRFPHFVNGIDQGQENLKEHFPPYYMSLMAKGFPNYWTCTSAYAPTPHGNWYQSSEAFAKYIVQCIDKMQRERILSIVPKNKAVEHFTRHSNAWLKRTAVSGPCVAWFKGNDGVSKPPSLWPGARTQFWELWNGRGGRTLRLDTKTKMTCMRTLETGGVRMLRVWARIRTGRGIWASLGER